MTEDQREIQRKLRILRYAEEIGHTGQDLRAGVGTVAIYLAMILSVFTRVAGGVWPEFSSPLHTMAGLFWIAAFRGFAIVYGAPLLRLPAAKRI